MGILKIDEIAGGRDKRIRDKRARLYSSLPKGQSLQSNYTCVLSLDHEFSYCLLDSTHNRVLIDNSLRSNFMCCL